MTQEDYVSFETARLLKEKGFDVPVERFYNTDGLLCMGSSSYNWNDYADVDDESKDYSRPTLQMAMKWLREEKDVQIEIPIVGTDTWESPTKWMYGFRCQTKDVIDRRNADFLSYEEA